MRDEADRRDRWLRVTWLQLPNYRWLQKYDKEHAILKNWEEMEVTPTPAELERCPHCHEGFSGSVKIETGLEESLFIVCPHCAHTLLEILP